MAFQRIRHPSKGIHRPSKENNYSSKGKMACSNNNLCDDGDDRGSHQH
ncbi:hypothetical protein CLCAR_4037 [Clostridium carboxidivorans P7]|nr:hypothetical protein CLCAR_4037 [Clostridium carboxidivorans P7]